MLLKGPPIRRKLMTIILLTSGAVLLLTCAAFFVYEFLTFRQTAERQLSTLGQIIAANSTAALAFENQADAKEILAALKAEPHIAAASLYDKQGRLFSKYPSNLSARDFPAAPGKDGYRFVGSYQVAFRPVVQGGNKRLGTLYLKSDMGAMYERFQLYAVIVLGVTMASFLLAYNLSRMLQKQISKPILALAETAKAISEGRDYSVRATTLGRAELGLLTDAFNQMLTQIHEQDRVLRESEERFRLMVATVKDYAIIMLDPTGRVVSWNAGAEGIEGYRAEEILGEHISRFHSAEDVARGEPERELKIAVATGGSTGEGWRVRKDGSRFCAHVVLTALRDETGQLRGFSKVTRDITERKMAEEKIRKLNTDLEQRVSDRTAELLQAKANLEAEIAERKRYEQSLQDASRTKSEFLANMSHELRTPLNGIIGFAEFLVDGKPGSLNPKQKEYLEDILNSGRHLLQLINDVLDLAKVEAGKMELNPETFSLRKAVEEVCAVSKPIAQKKNIQVSVEIAKELGSVTLDLPKVKQVLYNLLSNAIKFTNEGGQVDLLAEPQDTNRFCLAVKDTGIGIKAEDIKRLFNKFEQVESSASRRYEGTGLGLALTRKIVEMQGGTIDVVSELGKGSTFTVILPLITRQLGA